MIHSMTNESGGAEETVHRALEALLIAVAKAAEDLRMFHDTLGRARLAPLPPFPRTTVVTAERIIKNLGLVDSELRDLLAALGLVPRQ
jgi:hypothetical protein